MENNICKHLQARLNNVNIWINQKEQATRRAAPGKLRAAKKGKGWQYFIKTPKTGKNGDYLSKQEESLIRQLAQYEYDTKVLRPLIKERILLQKMIAFYQKSTPENCYYTMSKGKQIMSTPIVPDPHLLTEQWLSQSFEPGYYREGAATYVCGNNIRVRSKSEALIFDALSRNQIPFHYEKPLLLKRGIIIRPDFTIFDAFNNREIYWEHFGMMDDRSYVDETMLKIHTYSENHLFPGKGLIYTFETIRRPLDTQTVKFIIDDLLKDVLAC